MNRSSIKLSLLLVATLAVSSAAFGQGWPLPSRSQNTPVACSATSACAPPTTTPPTPAALTSPYADPIRTWVGRYLDSQATREWQPGFRTARARYTVVAPEKNRIYMIVGSALFSYDIPSFIRRLNANEALVPSTVFGALDGSGPRPNAEQFLLPDGEFYAEANQCQPLAPAPGCWQIFQVDGQDRLFGFDYDDRGYVYVAYNPYGWGIVKESATGALSSIYQQVPDSLDVTPNRVMSVKNSTGYYLIVSPDNGTSSNVYYLGDANNLAHDRKASIQHTFSSFAKATNAHIALTESNHLRVYNNDDIVNGVSMYDMTAPDGGLFYTVDTDGTNFYAVSQFGVGSTSPSNAKLTILTYSGGTYVPTTVDLGRPYGDTPAARYGPGGFLTVFGSESLVADPSISAHGANIRLYKIAGTVLTPVDIPVGPAQIGGTTREYFTNYYSRNGDPNYIAPAFSGVDTGNPGNDARIFKFGGKTYLIAAASGLGDVYELIAGDSITAKVKKIGQTPNPSAAGVAGPGPYYGDIITFTSTSTAATPPPVTWTFDGDAQAYARTAGLDMPYQWGNMTNSSFAGGPVTRNATVTVDANTSDHTSVQIQAPTIRLGISGHPELLFTQPDVSSSAPIVSSDQWIDASDGALEGHYTDWNMDGNKVTKTADAKTSVGGCGPHTLIFTTHYGPNLTQATSPSFTMVSTEATYSINPYTYTVLPFTATINEPAKDPNNAANILFTATMRLTSSATDLPGGGGTAATYTWTLLNADGSSAGVQQVTTATLGNPAPFSIAKSAFGSTTKQVQLKIDIAPAATACAGFNSLLRAKQNLSGPTGAITKNGCTTFGAPCSFTFGTPNAAWHYTWSATLAGGGTVPGFSGDGVAAATWTPNFPGYGDYTINVTVENAIGIFTATPFTGTLGAPACLVPSGAIPAYFGSVCNTPFDTCKLGETITFYVQATGWNAGSCNTFDWDFGDGSAHANTAGPTHVYNNAGQYTVTLVIGGAGVSPVTVTNTIKVGSGSIQPPPPPPPGNGGGGGGPCGTLNDSAVYVGFSGAISGCTATYGSCNATEGITFSPQSGTGFNLGCAGNTFTWNFGDGQTSNDEYPVHAYVSAGSYTVTLTVVNGSQVGTAHATVQVGSTSPAQCPPLTPSTISPTYSSNSETCVPGGSCNLNEGINLRVDPTGPASGCAISDYTWTFDDGTTSHSPTPTWTPTTKGDHTVKVSVSNAQTPTPVTVQFTIHVTALVGTCPEMTSKNISFGWYGGDTGCTPVYGNCKDTEQVGFNVYQSGYNFSCSTHTFTWDFGDGSPVESTGNQFITHKFRGGGTFEVDLTVTNLAGGSLTLSQTIHVDGPPIVARHRPAKH